MSVKTPPRGVEQQLSEQTGPHVPWTPDEPRHRLTNDTGGNRKTIVWVAALCVVVLLGTIGLIMYLNSNRGPAQRNSHVVTSSAPIQPPAARTGTAPTPAAAPEPTRTGVPELGPDNTLVVDGSNVVAGRHFAPGRYATVAPAVAGCTWRITTDKGVVVKASGGTGPMTTPTIKAGQWLTTYGCPDWRLVS